MADWTDEQEAGLIDLWCLVSRISTAEIGRRLGVSKNAVIGKAHRLGLPKRPSPIRNFPASSKADRIEQLRQMQKRGWSHSSMANTLGISQSWVQKELKNIGFTNAPPRRVVRTLKPLPSLVNTLSNVTVKPHPLSHKSFGPCCWVTGKARYCDAPITQRGPYCEDHRKLAYRTKEKAA